MEAVAKQLRPESTWVDTVLHKCAPPIALTTRKTPGGVGALLPEVFWYQTANMAVPLMYPCNELPCWHFAPRLCRTTAPGPREIQCQTAIMAVYYLVPSK